MAVINGQAGYNLYPMYYGNQVPVMPNNVPTTSQTFSNNSVVWVQGEAGAKAYPVAPGNRIALFDSENPVVYLKSVDSQGRPGEMEIYDLVKRETAKPDDEASKIDISQFVTKDEIKTVVSKSVKTELEKAMSEISLKPTSSRKKKGDDE